MLRLMTLAAAEPVAVVVAARAAMSKGAGAELDRSCWGGVGGKVLRVAARMGTRRCPLQRAES